MLHPQALRPEDHAVFNPEKMGKATSEKDALAAKWKAATEARAALVLQLEAASGAAKAALLERKTPFSYHVRGQGCF